MIRAFQNIIVFILVLAVKQGYAQIYPLDSKNPKGMDIYLVIGQSNMAGRAPTEGGDLDTLENVYLFTGDSKNLWERAANPLNKYSTIRKDLKQQKTGPAYHFARLLHDALPEKPIGLVVNCRGGSSINQWMPWTNFFKDAVSRTREAHKYGELKGIIWHQGESDVKDCKKYMRKISTLIAAFRKEFNNPNLPFVVGELSEDKPARVEFNRMIVNLPDSVNNTLVVSSVGLTTIDSTHFDTRSIRIFGERYAISMNKLSRVCSESIMVKKIQYDSENKKR